jgi:hypothetical protein
MIVLLGKTDFEGYLKPCTILKIFNEHLNQLIQQPNAELVTSLKR